MGKSSPAQRLALLPLFFTPAVIALFRHESPYIRKMWPTWQIPIEGVVLVCAVVIAIVAVSAGIVTWRRERREHA